MENSLQNNLIDELKIEGILYKGFGIVPKFVMMDTDLSIEAKGIYAYFCSFAGSGSCAFPGRDKILSDLQMIKDSYYKHFNLLKDNGYITVKENHNHGGQGNGFANNTYILNSNPKNLVAFESAQEAKNGFITSSGIKALGYGVISKAVMQDTRLSIKEKGLYAYYCSFAGAGKSATPKKSNILYHLGISDKSFRTYQANLISFGFISVSQQNKIGTFAENMITINDNPDMTNVVNEKQFINVYEPCGKIQDTQKSITGIISNSFVNQPCGKKPDTQKSYTQKQDTKSNNINNKQDYNNNKSIYQKTSSSDGQKNEKNIKLAEVEDFVKSYNLLDSYWSGNKEALGTAIKVLLDYNELSHIEYHDTIEDHQNYLMFVKGLIELVTEKPLLLEKINELLRQDNMLDQREYPLDKIKEKAIEKFLCVDLTNVKNKELYLKKIIYNEII